MAFCGLHSRSFVLCLFHEMIVMPYTYFSRVRSYKRHKLAVFFSMASPSLHFYTPHPRASGIFSGMSWTLPIKRIVFIFIFSEGGDFFLACWLLFFLRRKLNRYISVPNGLGMPFSHVKNAALFFYVGRVVRALREEILRPLYRSSKCLTLV